MSDTEMDRLSALMSSAANLGATYKAKADAAKEAAAKNKATRDQAVKSVADDDFSAGGFASHRYLGLTEMAGTLRRHFNTDSNESRQAARAMADSFMQSFTGQGVKSLNGGKQAGYASVIALGDDAERCRVALQSRLEHWRSIHDSDVEGESGGDRAARRAEARMYLTPCGDAPNEDGSLPTNKDGTTRQPKFNGRPAREVNGVKIPFGRGTDRDAQFAAFARLFEQYRDAVFHPEVVDAFLSNGGKWKPNATESVDSLANEAVTAIDKLVGMAGDSGDVGFLQAAAAVLGRIAREGFKSSNVAAPITEPETPDDSAGDTESTPEGDTDPADVLAGLGETPDTGTEAPGEPVALGRPSRPRRNRNKGGEAAAA